MLLRRHNEAHQKNVNIRAQVPIHPVDPYSYIEVKNLFLLWLNVLRKELAGSARELNAV